VTTMLLRTATIALACLTLFLASFAVGSQLSTQSASLPGDSVQESTTLTWIVESPTEASVGGLAR